MRKVTVYRNLAKAFNSKVEQTLDATIRIKNEAADMDIKGVGVIKIIEEMEVSRDFAAQP